MPEMRYFFFFENDGEVRMRWRVAWRMRRWGERSQSLPLAGRFWKHFYKSRAGRGLIVLTKGKNKYFG